MILSSSNGLTPRVKRKQTNRFDVKSYKTIKISINGVEVNFALCGKL